MMLSKVDLSSIQRDYELTKYALEGHETLAGLSLKFSCRVTPSHPITTTTTAPPPQQAPFPPLLLPACPEAPLVACVLLSYILDHRVFPIPSLAPPC